ALKHLFRYIKGTTNYTIIYNKGREIITALLRGLYTVVDTAHANMIRRISIGGYIIFLAGGLII
ncbi:hypothetical protein ACRALDRAFT_2114102, partial [Sodiomyces alcalophilus JCM 7366]|uniref:uncharacterized protein n=1 Tax=Sodiomyces alcalophilus JCM 7366 TaxID=591952 RepID=UPI0039B40408